MTLPRSPPFAAPRLPPPAWPTATRPFVFDDWYVAAFVEELPAGRLLARTLLGRRVVLYRSETGAVVALDDRCPPDGWRATRSSAATTGSASMPPRLHRSAVEERRRQNLSDGAARAGRLDLDG